MVEERRKADGNSGQHILTIMCELFRAIPLRLFTRRKKSYASVYFISIYYISNVDLIFVKDRISQFSVCKFNMYICAILKNR